MSFGDKFETSLQTDISSLQNFQNAFNNGMNQGDAFNATMKSASVEAQAYAQAVGAASIRTGDFEEKQRLAQISLISQNKSLITCKSLIVDYNNKCASAGVSQSQFINAIKQSNVGLANYLSGLNGAKGTLGGYITSLIGAKAASIAMQAATMALNMALTTALLRSGRELHPAWQTWLRNHSP